MNRFLNELQRRNVIKAVVSYFVLSWILLQVGSLIFPILNINEGALKILLYALIGLLPFWVVFAYIFEWTPSGFKKTSEVKSEQSIHQQTNKRLNQIIIVGLTLAVVLLIIDRYTNFTGLVEKDRAKAIAVLPFENLSGDDDAYFALGVTEDILTQVSKIGDLRVLSRFTLRDYESKGKSIQEIGKDLGVEYLLTGSIRRLNNELRISCQLVQVNPEEETWAENFDKRMEDVFAIQNEVALQVANMLQAQLSPLEKENLNLQPTDNILAYNLYLRGRDSYEKYNAEDNQKAIKFFKEAISLDPEFGNAWSGLADASLKAAWDYGTLSHDYLDSTEAYGFQAMELAPTLPEPYKTLGTMYYVLGDFQKSKEYYEKALIADPKHSPALANLALLYTSLGELDLAIELYQRNLKLNPLQPLGYSNIANRYMALSMYEEARNNLKIGFRLNNTDWHTNMVYAYLFTALNKSDSAKYHLNIVAENFKESAHILGEAGLSARYFDSDYSETLVDLAINTKEFDPFFKPELLVGKAHLIQLKDSSRSKELNQQAFKIINKKIADGNEDNYYNYLLSALYTMNGEHEEALTQLKTALDNGFFYDRSIENDPWLTNLKGIPEFDQLINTYYEKENNLRRKVRQKNISMSSKTSL